MQYRNAVGEVADQIASMLEDSDHEKVRARIESVLVEPDLSGLLDRLGPGLTGVADSLMEEAMNFRPDLASSLVDRTMLVEVFLLSRIDALWWGDTPTFQTDSDICGTSELVDLDALRNLQRLRFRYRRQPVTWPSRGAAWVQRRLLPARRPHASGLRFTRSRPEGVALLNRLGSDCARSLGSDHPALWVTSLVRSEQHQLHLRSLGYSAFLPSAHCTGHAIDVEVRWFERFGAADTLKALLNEYQEQSLINVIDEGQAWHICINPAAMGALRQEFAQSSAG